MNLVSWSMILKGRARKSAVKGEELYPRLSVRLYFQLARAKVTAAAHVDPVSKGLFAMCDNTGESWENQQRLGT